MTEAFAPYAHAIASLALWSLIILTLGLLSTVGRTSDRAPCGKPVRDYANPVYRRERAFANALENSGPFVAATVAAILVGASPFWTNMLASIFIVARIVMAFVHIRTENQPMRSAFYAVGLFCTIGLALFGFLGALTL
ncbi:MAG: MAPEG family protein [Jannaschia sp.]